jgi:hypothetical protein
MVALQVCAALLLLLLLLLLLQLAYFLCDWALKHCQTPYVYACQTRQWGGAAENNGCSAVLAAGCITLAILAV